MPLTGWVSKNIHKLMAALFCQVFGDLKIKKKKADFNIPPLSSLLARSLSVWVGVCECV